jgi:hypothetical protein
MNYKFSYRRRWRWQARVVRGHHYEAAQDKIVLYLERGGIEEVPHWKDCAVRLGPDWVLAMQKAKEAEIGQQIPLEVGTNGS